MISSYSIVLILGSRGKLYRRLDVADYINDF